MKLNKLTTILMQNHNKAAVMILAVPATLALFERTTDSESLLNTASSMLCLASLHNGKILAQYAVQLIKHILKGSIFTEYREPCKKQSKNLVFSGGKFSLFFCKVRGTLNLI
jgi:hypothetical protein